MGPSRILYEKPVFIKVYNYELLSNDWFSQVYWSQYNKLKTAIYERHLLFRERTIITRLNQMFVDQSKIVAAWKAFSQPLSS